MNTREILFRAKRKNWRKLPKEEWWIEGYYCYFMNEHCILPKNLDADAALFGEQKVFVTIDPETLCQYTGLNDKNGSRICENDIIIFSGVIIHIKWSGKDAGWCLVFRGSPDEHFFGGPLKPDRCKVIGNIFDNPELLKGE